MHVYGRGGVRGMHDGLNDYRACIWFNFNALHVYLRLIKSIIVVEVVVVLELIA
jgi:hypothetical protein